MIINNTIKWLPLKRVVISTASLFFSLSASAEEATSQQETILFLGDSITSGEGYVRAIDSVLKSTKNAPKIINRGKGSETVSGLSEAYHPGVRPCLFTRLDRELKKHKPDWIVACYGINCGIYHPFDKKRFEAYQEGIKKLIKKAQDSESKLILLTSPPYAKSGPAFPKDTDATDRKKLLEEANNLAQVEAKKDPKKYGYRTPYAYYDHVMETYATWLLTLNTQKNVWVIDLRTPMNQKLKETHGRDPIHPNKTGHEFMANSFLKEWPRIQKEAVSGKKNPTNKEKPNIIYINVDDLGWADVGYQGSTYYETPNIDKLASQGMIFTNGYAASANCAPSRACALSGQATPRHGVYTVNSSERGPTHTRKIIPIKNTLHLTDDNLTIGHAMKKAGYITATMGKWHVTADPLKNGFDINIGGTKAGGPYNGGYHSPYKYPNLVKTKPGTYLTDHLTDEAIKFVTTNKDKAFFLYLPYFTVHTPIQGQKEKIEYFKKKKTSEGQQDPAYAAMISSLDDNIGKLTKALDDLKIADNTIVIFTSDNGGVYGISKQNPLRAGKGSYYEGGIREPFIVRWPAKVKPSKNDTPITNLDLFPTLLDLTQTKMPNKTLDGASILPLLNDQTIEDRSLYWHFPIYLESGNKDCQDPIFRTRPGSAIRHGDWKLIQYFENNDIELYNLKKDQGERNNLAESNPEKVKELLAKLDTWRKELKAPIPTEQNPDFGKKPAKKKGKGKKGQKEKKKAA